MIKFIYEIDNTKKYLFWYNVDRGSASVTFPNGTTSETDRLENSQEFGDWVDSVLGHILPTNTFSLFQYIFKKEISRGAKEFIIQAAYLTSNCMTNAERDAFKFEAIQLDNEYFRKTGLRFQFGPVQIIYASRHRIDAHLLLMQFQEALNR